MKFLLIARQKKNVDTFRATITRLVAQGHEVRVAVQEDDPDTAIRVSDGAVPQGLTAQSAPVARGDQWRTDAPLFRRLRDWLQYLSPEYAGAETLRLRVVDRLCAELGIPATALGDGFVPGLGGPQVERLKALMARLEAAIPSDALHEESIAESRPDVVLVTPGVHFGSAQADFIKSARAAGIPVWMLLFSWDNLSTKGALHVAPDLLFVWNERQRREAMSLHDMPREKVVVVGAPRFDAFFALRPALSRPAFFEPLGLDPEAPTLLYLCSSRLVARRELPFVERWLAAVRASGDPRLSRCNVLVRPHPDIPLLHDDVPTTVSWRGLPRVQGWVSRPFQDARALVLRTTYATQQALFECLYHSVAAVGLNTSAELEAGIVGRPVFTVTVDDAAVTGQASTLHFHYLLKEHGGFVESAPSLEAHVAGLARAVAGEIDPAPIHAFIQTFLRPRGDVPVADILAKTLVKHAGRAKGSGGITQEPATTPVPADVPARKATRPVAELRIGYRDSVLTVLAAPDTRKRQAAGDLVLDPRVVTWLDAQVQPNDVVYDIGAGQGEYALVAAAHRNATVLAFEPGFAAYGRLCDNVVRNACRGSVIPVSAVLGDRASFSVLEFPDGRPGESDHRVRRGPWRRGPYESPSRYAQPVVVDRLDDLIRRYDLPAPNHLRVQVQRTEDAVLRGALETLRQAALRSVLLVLPTTEHLAAREQALAEAGLRLASALTVEGGSTVLVFLREHVPATPGRSDTGWTGAVRRYFAAVASDDPR